MMVVVVVMVMVVVVVVVVVSAASSGAHPPALSAATLKPTSSKPFTLTPVERRSVFTAKPACLSSDVE